MLTTANDTVEREQGPDREHLDRLLNAVAQGDKDALGQLYHLTRGAVYAMALSMLRDPHEAQDVTQDAFVTIWQKAASYRSQGSPMAWMLTITRNLTKMRLRQSARLGELTDEEWNAIPAQAPGVTAEDRIVQDALKTLSAQERQIVLLHASSGLKHREIAVLLELPLSTVLSKYRRALEKLKTQLEGDDHA